MKKILILVTIGIIFNCFKKDKDSHKDVVSLLTAVAYNFPEECVHEYSGLSNYYNFYSNLFPSFNGSKVIWIADSTIDFGRYELDFTTSLSDNRAIYGNTACDFLYQLKSVSIGYETLIVGTMDGNGLVRGVSSEVSIKTLEKVFTYGANTLNIKNIVAIGIHPIPDQSLNSKKNIINNAIKKISLEKGYCYIDMVSLFGKTDSQFPDENQMKPGDKLHYDSSIYPLLKSKIKTQCGVDV